METRTRVRNFAVNGTNQPSGNSCRNETTYKTEEEGRPIGGLRGLVNLGCTCYINSVIQVLAHTDAIYKYFKNNSTRCTESHCVVCELVFFELLSGARTPLAVTKLLYSVWKLAPEFADGGMHDAHDFWLMVISAFARHKNGSSLIDVLLRGRLATTLRCESCDNLSFVSESVFDLSLPLRISHSFNEHLTKDDTSSTGLASSMDSSISSESGVTRSCQSGCEGVADQVSSAKEEKRVFRRCGKCENCVNPKRKKGCLRNKILRSFTYENCPHLEDDFLSEMKPDSLGHTQSVTLEQCLSESTKTELLQSWKCSQCGILRNAKRSTFMEKFPPLLALHLKRFEFNPYTGLSRKLETHVHCPAILEASCFGSHIPKEELSWYNLVAIIAHCGNLNGGHFWTYIKKQNVWYKINDSIITRVEYKEVENSQAYMVFYEKQIDLSNPMKTQDIGH